MIAKRKMAIGFVVLALVGLFFLLPKHKCGNEENDPEYSKLIDRAETGDRLAIATVYAYDKKRGIQPLIEYWALKGAFRGDTLLQKDYVQLFRERFTKEEQQRALEIVGDNIAQPGAPCLLAILINDKQQEAICTAMKQKSRPE